MCGETGPCRHLLEGWTCWSPAPRAPTPGSPRAERAGRGGLAPGSPRPPAPPVSWALHVISAVLCRGQVLIMADPIAAVFQLLCGFDRFSQQRSRKGQTWAPGLSSTPSPVFVPDSVVTPALKPQRPVACGCLFTLILTNPLTDHFKAPLKARNSKTIGRCHQGRASRVSGLLQLPPPTATLFHPCGSLLQPLCFLSGCGFVFDFKVHSTLGTTSSHDSPCLLCAPRPPGLTPPVAPLRLALPPHPAPPCS